MLARTQRALPAGRSRFPRKEARLPGRMAESGGKKGAALVIWSPRHNGFSGPHSPQSPPEPRSHAGRLSLKCPERAPTHLVALGLRGATLGSRQPRLELQTASWLWSQSACRQVQLSPDSPDLRFFASCFLGSCPPQPARHRPPLGPRSPETVAGPQARGLGSTLQGALRKWNYSGANLAFLFRLVWFLILWSCSLVTFPTKISLELCNLLLWLFLSHSRSSTMSQLPGRNSYQK